MKSNLEHLAYLAELTGAAAKAIRYAKKDNLRGILVLIITHMHQWIDEIDR